MATTATTLETTAHLIQVALTPVFLLSGIGTLLSIFSTRLGRVADRIDSLIELDQKKQDDSAEHLQIQMEHLRRRSHLLDWAVISGAAGGSAACVATIILFITTLLDWQMISVLLYLALATALVCTFVAINLFMTEVLLANGGIRRRAKKAEAAYAVRA